MMGAKFFPHGAEHKEGDWVLTEERIKSGMRRRWRIERINQDSGTVASSMLISTDQMEDLADLLDRMLDFIEQHPKRGVTG